MADDGPLVAVEQLDYDEAAGLIILCASGTRFSSQTGGVMCHHPEAEGLFVLLPWPGGVVPTLHGEHGQCEPDETVYAALERAFPFLRVNRNAANEEAWVFGAYAGLPCIVTWGNCD